MSYHTRPRIDPTAYAKEKQRKIEAARKRREEIARRKALEDCGEGKEGEEDVGVDMTQPESSTCRASDSNNAQSPRESSPFREQDEDRRLEEPRHRRGKSPNGVLGISSSSKFCDYSRFFLGPLNPSGLGEKKKKLALLLLRRLNCQLSDQPLPALRVRPRLV